MNHDDLDLTNRLQQPQPPEDGAARARRTATKRRHRRQAIATGFGAVMLVGAATVALLAPDPFESDITVHNANSSFETTTSTTTTVVTPTTVDPLQRYVGLVHDERGAGLPLGTEILNQGAPQSKDDATGAKKGERILFWVGDD